MNSKSLIKKKTNKNIKKKKKERYKSQEMLERYRYLVYIDEETDMRGLKELLKSRCVEDKDIEFIAYKGTVTKGKELEIQREFPDSLFREITKGISIFGSIGTAEVEAEKEKETMENSNSNTRKVMFISRVVELNLEAKDNGISVIEIK